MLLAGILISLATGGVGGYHGCGAQAKDLYYGPTERELNSSTAS